MGSTPRCPGVCLVLLLGGACAHQPPLSPRGPTPERWLRHLTDELLPFWDRPSALGNPVGEFPTTRCDDGAAVDWSKPCPEVGRVDWLRLRRTSVVALSRQIYGYGVAFHLTGDPRYLAYARAGVEFLRGHGLDRRHGGAFSYREDLSGHWGPEPEARTAQELAYSVLGLSFYYYLTRDPDVLRDVLQVRATIASTLFRPEGDFVAWTSADASGDRRLTAQLDQLNTHLVLLAPLLPEPQRAAWLAEAKHLCHVLIEQFYRPEENLFADRRERRGATPVAADFGHGIKSFWMIRWVGRMTGDAELVSFAERNGARLLERAFLPGSGAWASGVSPSGALELDKPWWIFIELDQFAATMALSDPTAAAKLDRATEFYFSSFVDHRHGEVWNALRGADDRPDDALPKTYPWKSAYHTFEHVLVGAIVASQLHHRPLTLSFAFKDETVTRDVAPYFFSGRVRSVTSSRSPSGDVVQRVTFDDIR